MRSKLEFGRRYRAQVALPAAAKSWITAELLAQELQRYQLFGQVTNTKTGYRVDATFRGKSGVYELPEQVETLEMVG